MKILFFIAFLVSIIASSSAITLPCTFKQSTQYLCEITSFNLTSQDVNDRIITEISGLHLDGKTNADVETILSSNIIINYLYLGIDSYFPNLKSVIIFFGELLELQASDLAQFPKATSFIFFSNKITALPNEVFSGNPLVEFIDLSFNKITCVSSTAFNGLNNLKNIKFNGNTCTTFSASNATLVAAGLPTVYASCVCTTTTTAEPTTTTELPTTTTEPPTTTTESPTTTAESITTPAPVTPNPCIEASENQTIEFNNTIDSLKGFFTDSINSALTGVCRINNIDLVNTRIQNLDDDLTAFVTQTNSNFQNALDVLNSLTSAIDNLDSELRTFRDATYAKLNDLEECSCKSNNGNCGNNGNEKCNGNGKSG